MNLHLEKVNVRFSRIDLLVYRKVAAMVVSELKNTVTVLKILLLRYWASSRRTFVFVALIVSISSVTTVATPYLFSKIIDRLTSETWFDTIITCFFLYALLTGISVWLRNTVQYLSFMSAENFSFIARISFFERILKKNVRFFFDYNPAEIQSAQATGQQALNQLLQLALIVFIPGITQITLALVVLAAAINTEVSVMVLAYGIVFIGVTYYANERTRPLLEAAFVATQQNAKFIGNAVNAMETLRYFGSDRWIAGRFAEKALEVRDNWRRFCLRRIGYSGVYGVALAVQFSITFLLLLPRYRAGALSIGDVVLFNTLLLQLNQPFEMIGQAIDNMIRSYSQFLPFVRMWLAPEEVEPTDHRRLALSNGQIAFEGVGFSYENGRGVQCVNFVAERGRITYLTGETGAGKSTVFKLVLKSLEPEKGRISIDGIDLRAITRTEWFAAIGIVPQEVMLLNDTLTTNIVLGRPLDEKRLREAAEKAAILRFIESLPDGFHTKTGERGLRLSGGERQRIAIARALYAEPQILFLDEASSALDEATEKDIMDRLRMIADEVTIIAITHRKNVFAPGDRVVQLEGGRVIA